MVHNTTINLAFVGTGPWARKHHFPALDYLRTHAAERFDVRLRGVFSLERADAEAVAAQYGFARVYDSLDALVADRAINADIYKELRGANNYQTAKYTGQNLDNRIRKITVEGKFDSAVGTAESGDESGKDITIKNNYIETQSVAQDLADRLMLRYNVVPALISVNAEYLPSLETSRLLSLDDAQAGGALILGQLVKNNIDPSSFTGKLTLFPFFLTYDWSTKSDWDSYKFLTGTSDIYVPHDWNWLILKHQAIAANYREYRIDVEERHPGKKAKWLNLNYEADLDSGLIYLDHFDYDPTSRYEAIVARQSHLGLWSFDSSNYRVYIDGIGTEQDTGLFLKLLGINDDPVTVLDDIELRTKFACERRSDMSDQDLHFYGNYLRYISITDFFHTFVKFVSGISSPRLSMFWYAIQSYANCELAHPDGEYLYLNLNQEYNAISSVNQGQYRFAVSPGFDLTYSLFQSENDCIQKEPRSPLSEGIASWLAAGFCRCNGWLYSFDVYRKTSAPGNLEIKAWTSDDDITYTDHSGNTYPTGGTTPANFNKLSASRYLKIRVTLSRTDKYYCDPILKRMSVGYQISV